MRHMRTARRRADRQAAWLGARHLIRRCGARRRLLTGPFGSVQALRHGSMRLPRTSGRAGERHRSASFHWPGPASRSRQSRTISCGFSSTTCWWKRPPMRRARRLFVSWLIECVARSSIPGRIERLRSSRLAQRFWLRHRGAAIVAACMVTVGSRPTGVFCFSVPCWMTRPTAPGVREVAGTRCGWPRPMRCPSTRRITSRCAVRSSRRAFGGLRDVRRLCSELRDAGRRPALPGGAPLAVHSLLRLPFGRDQISSNSPPSISKRFARIGAGREGSSSLTER